MCGIAGQFSFTSSPAIDTLEEMNTRVAHRGPDDAGIFQDGPVGLAHRRLSIIDLETGAQPIYNEDDSVVVIFNGEIYNYQSLRESLSSAGHEFTTETDTEVLVHLYEDYGPSFVGQLEGMFAFALWDAEQEQLLLARDPMGIKPLVIAETTDEIGFGSELPSLLGAGLDHGGLDREALAQYFAFGYIPAPKTAFQNITKLRPGEYAVISADGMTRKQFYQPQVGEHSPGLETAATELRTLVESAVEKRLMSDVPLGAFLSGGVDSSIVVGAMAGLVDEPVNTFTVGFEQDLFDESWAAREVANYHDTNHHEFTMSANDVQELIPEVLSRLGEPFADQSLLPSYVVARETSRDVKVALSGDGADELFAGYDKYRVESLSPYYRAVPQPLRERALEPSVNALPASRGNRVGDLVYKGQWFVNRSSPSEVPERHFELMRISDSTTAEAYSGISPVDVGIQGLQSQHDALPDGVQHRDDLARIQAVDTRYSLPNQMLYKVDLASMYNSLEVRVPFLDTSVAEYAMSLPTAYKLDGRNRKRVLKQAFEDILPSSIFERNKQGFDMPIGEWFKNELATEFTRVVQGIDLGVLSDGAVFDIYDEHVSGRSDHGKFLWSVFVFKYWGLQMREQGVLDPDE